MKGSEADFDPEDPMPFIMRNHFQIPALLLGVAYHEAPWKKFDINIGKVVEVGGDQLQISRMEWVGTEH